MNREIKLQVFFYDGQDFSTGIFLTAQQAFEENYIEFVDGELKPTDSCSIIRQYTGLKDKHGTEIYEGDILKEDTHGVFEVVWEVRQCKFWLDWKRTSPSIQYPGWGRGVRMEVIGNIYQNPDLLK